MEERVPRPPARLRRVLAWCSGGIGLALAFVAGVAAWLAFSQPGARFVLERSLALVGGTATGVQGRLAGPLAVESIEVSAGKTRVKATLLAIDWSPSRLLASEVRVDKLFAAALEVESEPSEGPAKEPSTLSPPFAVHIEQAGLDRLVLITRGEAKAVELRDLSAKLAGDRAAWIVGDAQALTPVGRARLSGTLGALAPFALDAKGALEGLRGDRKYGIALAARGPLAGFEAEFSGSEGGLEGGGKARIAPFGPTPLRALSVKLAGLDLSAFASTPQTRLAVDAQLAPEGGLLLAGPVQIVNSATGPLDRNQLPVASLGARLEIAKDGTTRAQGVEALFAGGGSAKGDLAWAKGQLDAALEVKGLDLLAWHTKLRATGLAGSVRAEATGEAQSFTLDLADPRFTLAGAARIANRAIDIERVRIARTASAVEAAGRFAFTGKREFTLEGRLDRVNPAQFAKVPEGEISGGLKASGHLGEGGSVQALLEIAKSRFAGLALEGRAEVSADDGRLGRVEASLAMGESRASASGAFGKPGDALAVKFFSPDLAPIGNAFGFRAAGRVEGDALVEGTYAAPSGRVAMKAANLSLPGEMRLASLEAKLALGAAEGSPLTGDVTLAGLREDKAGDKEALVTKAALALRGTRVAHDLRLEGELPENSRFRVLLSGGLFGAVNASSEWRGRLEVLESTGRYPVVLAAPAALSLSAGRFELGGTKLTGDWGHIDLVTTRWTPALLEAKGVGRGITVRTMARLAGLRQAPSSNLVVGASWDLRAGETIEGFAELRRESGDVRVGDARQPLGLETLFLRLDAAGGRVKAKGDIRGAQVGSWQADGEASLRRTETGWEVSPVAPVAGRLDVDVPDLGWTAGWLGPDAQAGGKLAGRVALSGTVRDPAWEGRIDGSNLLIRDPASGFEGRDGVLAVAFRDHELRLEKLVFDSPWRPTAEAAKAIARVQRPERGSLTAEGVLNFETRKGEIRVKSTAYPVTQLSTRFLAVTGDARVELDGTLLAITGDLRADAGWFGIPASAAPSVSDDVIVERGEPVEGAAPSERIRLDLRVALGDHTHFTGRGLTTRLAGSLRLAGDVGAGLRATGSIRAVDGTYDAYGQKLAIERGALNFLGPIDNPGLNVLALRKGLPVEAGVEILGNVARPRVRLVSQPDVPDPEKLAWLVLGRGQGQVSASDAAILVSAAGSILGRDGTQSGKLLGGLGLSADDIRLGQDNRSLLGTMPQSTVAGKTGTTSTQDVLSVGKRLSDDIYLSYQQGLADAEGSMRVAWQVTRSFQLILRAGYQQGIDGVYRFSLDDAPVKLRP
jgi:translocation and assembly module TamB